MRFILVALIGVCGCYSSFAGYADEREGGDIDVAPDVEAGGDDAEAEAEADAEAAADVVPDADVDHGVDADADADVEAESDADADGDAGACDGAWRDPTTGYLWENPPVAGMRWDEAVTYCNGLRLCGYGPGSWHLPTVSELRTLIRGCPATESGGWCGVTDSCLSDSCEWEPCVGCGYLSGPGPGGCYWDSALGGWCSWYWSSSSSAGGASYAWTVYFNYGYVGYYDETYTDSVRCVRRGP